MSQHDLDIANALFPATRADINLALKALGSTSIGASAPSTPYDGQQWIDNAGSPWNWKVYDLANTAWLSIATINTSTGVFQFNGLATTSSPQLTALNLGHATDTTIARVSAGLISVEGVTVPLLALAQTFSKAQRGSITTLTSTTNSVAVDLALNNHYLHTLTENTTFANPTNIVAGQSGSIFITQAAGLYTAAFGSYYKFPAGTAPTITAVDAAEDRVDYIVKTTTKIECVWTGTSS